MAKKQPLKPGEKVLFAMAGAFVVLGVIAWFALEAVRMNSDTPLFETKTRYEFNAEAQLGSRLFREARCTSCHRAMRNGTNMGLSLDGIGSAHTYEWILTFLKDPESVYTAKTIDHGAAPKEAAYVSSLPEEDLVAIASFLYGLKSDQGSSSAPMPPEGRSEFIDAMVRTWAPPEWKEKYQDVRTREPQPAQ